MPRLSESKNATASPALRASIEQLVERLQELQFDRIDREESDFCIESVRRKHNNAPHKLMHHHCHCRRSGSIGRPDVEDACTHHQDATGNRTRRTAAANPPRGDAGEDVSSAIREELRLPERRRPRRRRRAPRRRVLRRVEQARHGSGMRLLFRRLRVRRYAVLRSVRGENEAQRAPRPRRGRVTGHLCVCCGRHRGRRRHRGRTMVRISVL